MDIAVFTSFKPFSGSAAALQTASLANWRSILPDARIVNFETRLAKSADFPADVETVVLDADTPLPVFGAMVREVARRTEAELFLYANGDILFDGTLHRAFASAPRGDFLLTGQRIDRDENGARHLHRPCGMDYFLFRRGMFGDLPSVTMGRGYCDSALVAYCLRRGIPVVDASFAVRVEHPFHGYGHVPGGAAAVRAGAAARQNLAANGLRGFAPNCLDATFALSPDGRLGPNRRASLLRKLELELYYRRGWRKCPPFNAWWNLLTRGGRYGRQPRWPGAGGVQ